MILANALLWREDHWETGDLAMENGVICESSCGPRLDCGGWRLMPGLVDVHTHGIAGFDFGSAAAEEIGRMEEAYLHQGTTTLLATLVSLAEESYFHQAKALLPRCGEAGPLLGIHAEGPFLAPAKKGAHNGEYLKTPDPALAQALWQAFGGRLMRMTAAPELPGIPELEAFAAGKFTLSLGHTACDYEQARRALRQGFCAVTHLYNAMPPMHHRQPGPVAAALESDAWLEMICDGIHLADGVIRMMFRGFSDRIVLISDSIAACGLGDGAYELGGLAVSVKARRATLGDGTLAGSAFSLWDCLTHCLEIGIPEELAIPAATSHPARLLGREDSLGTLRPGARADILAADENWRLRQVWKNGKSVAVF